MKRCVKGGIYKSDSFCISMNLAFYNSRESFDLFAESLSFQVQIFNTYLSEGKCVTLQRTL